MTTSHDIEIDGDRDDGGDSDDGGDVARHARALADPTRRRIFRMIADSDAPVDVPTLTAQVGVHHTAVRSHLTVLHEAGLVTEQTEQRHRPGRPRLQYRLAPDLGGAWETPDAYRRLAALLARAVRTGSTAVEAGRCAAGVDRSRLPDDPLDALLEAVTSQGFDPVIESHSVVTASLTLRRCPFVDVASLDPATVCGLHLGLAEGMAEQIGGLTVDHLTHTDPRSAGCHLQVSFEDDNKRSEQ